MQVSPTGEYTSLLTMVSIVERPSAQGELTNDELMVRVRSHIHRGIGMMSVRVRSPADLVDL